MSSPPASGVTDPQGASPLTAGELRHQSEVAASHLPPLLVEAQHLAGSVLLGEHGRRRAGMGDDFWQYRPVQLGDSRRMIDHRRSAKGDQQFVREREWQIAQVPFPHSAKARRLSKVIDFGNRHRLTLRGEDKQDLVELGKVFVKPLL